MTRIPASVSSSTQILTSIGGLSTKGPQTVTLKCPFLDTVLTEFMRWKEKRQGHPLHMTSVTQLEEEGGKSPPSLVRTSFSVKTILEVGLK